jgi:hypothetical protein
MRKSPEMPHTIPTSTKQTIRATAATDDTLLFGAHVVGAVQSSLT